jgi:LmbE family N-acetylglucosaminyl deacetylase
MKRDVFVSYAGADERWVRAFTGHLRDLGLTFYEYKDPEDPQINSPVAATLERRIANSRHFVVILSKSAVRRRAVGWEIDKARSRQVNAKHYPIYPVMIEALEDRDIKKFALGGVPILNVCQQSATNDKQATYERLLKQLIPSAPKERSWPRCPPWPLPIPRTFEIVRSGKVLAIGAHWDDILLGCFGTLLKLRLLEDYEVRVAVLCTDHGERYYGVPQCNLNRRAARIYEQIQHRFHFAFDNGKNGHEGSAANRTANVKLENYGFRNKLDALRTRMSELASANEECNLILVPPADDHHEDHALTGQLAATYFRRPHQLKLEYEIKRYQDRSFVPSIFVRLDDEVPGTAESVADLKVRLLSRWIVKGTRHDSDDTLDTKINNSSFLFDERSLEARLRINSLDHGGDTRVQFGEIFRGKIAL